MPKKPEPTPIAGLAPLARRLTTELDKAADWTARADATKALIREACGDATGAYVDGDWHVTLAPNTRLNTAALAAVYPISQAPQLYGAPVVTASLARAGLPAAVIDEHTDTYDHRVNVKKAA